MVSYYAKIEPASEGGFLVRFPDVPNATTQGGTLEEAKEMAEDSLRTLFLGLMKLGKELPKPGKQYRGRTYHRILLPALESAKVELYRAWRDSGIRRAEIASRMGIPRTHVDRLFNLNHGSRLDQIESAFRALGKHLVIHVEDAA